jgi:hypothetical protein
LLGCTQRVARNAWRTCRTSHAYAVPPAAGPGEKQQDVQRKLNEAQNAQRKWRCVRLPSQLFSRSVLDGADAALVGVCGRVLARWHPIHVVLLHCADTHAHSSQLTS